MLFLLFFLPIAAIVAMFAIFVWLMILGFRLLLAVILLIVSGLLGDRPAAKA